MTFQEQLQKWITEENFGFFSDKMCYHFETAKDKGVYHEHVLPLQKEIGQIFLKNELYSQGSDFTHDWQVKENHENRSYLKRLWRGEKNLSHHDRVSCWTLLENQKPIGVATLEKTQQNLVHLNQDKAYEIGSLSVYLNPKYRNQGKMKVLIQEQIRPYLEEQAQIAHSLGFIPFVGAEDAAETLLLGSGVQTWIIPFHLNCSGRTEYLQKMLGKKTIKKIKK